MAVPCYVVPPHLFRAMANSNHLDESTRSSAREALKHLERSCAAKKDHFDKLAKKVSTQKRKPSQEPPSNAQQSAQEVHEPGQKPQKASRQNIVPPHIFQKLSVSRHVSANQRANATRDLDHLRSLHDKVHHAQQHQQSGSVTEGVATATATETAKRSVYDAHHTEDESMLPGTLLRDEGQPAVTDEPANQVYDNVGDVLQMYSQVFNWDSIDNKNMPIVSSVHYGNRYENAFWDPQIMQMVFGDGGDFIANFTGALDVIGHELTHAVTEHTTPLRYWGQSGALNEHVSDAFGIMIKQWKLKQDSASADWLIGEDCLLPGVAGVALRSMKAPGTAYDDPRFGKDPQPDNFKDYHAMLEDNGGVHVYSGIPNKAFYLSAVAFGGYSWEKAGQIWWQTLNSGKVKSNSTFLEFANATVDVAQQSFGDDAAQTVRSAWDSVGVVKSTCRSKWEGCMSVLH